MKTVSLFLALALHLIAVDKNEVDGLMTKILSKKKIRTVMVAKNPFVGVSETRPEPIPKTKPHMGFNPTIQGVINQKALINGKLYRVGDRINGYTLQTLTEKGATFVKNGMVYAAGLSNGESEILIKRDR